VSDETDEGGAPRADIARFGLIALVLALVALAGAIVWRTLDQGAGEESAASAPVDSLESLRENAERDPDNPDGWRELGFALFESGQFAEAAEAYRRGTEAAPQDASLWSAYGEALVMASAREPMPGQALDAFRKALERDPSDPRARYFLGVKKDLDGDHEGAIADWLALLRDTPAGAPWEADLKRTIEQVGKINKIATEKRIAQALAARPTPAAAPQLTAPKAIPGPSQQQLAAASAIPPGEQRAMAQTMVARLEARLEREPNNLDGWAMLMRSRMVLGEPDKARRALDDAIRANPSAAERLRAEARALGVDAE